MLNVKGPDADLGVIVARFQTPFLTEGHQDLIMSVRSRHKKFLIILGVSPVIPSKTNPLDYSTRYRMLADAYPGVEVQPLRDSRSDEMWSQNLDSIIRIIHPHEKVVLYGSRDSFVGHYTGKFPTVELDQIHGVNATLARSEAFQTIRSSEDFRAGICYATANQYRKNVLAVDVAIIKTQTDGQALVLVRKKEDKGLWRFTGGHINVGSETAEAAGRREASEETGCQIETMTYLGSAPIVDWRYKGNDDGMFTIFFEGKYLHGPVKAADDVDDVGWFELRTTEDRMIVPEHRVLHDMLLRKYGYRGVDQITEANGDIVDRHWTFIDGKKTITSPTKAEDIMSAQ